MSNMAERSSSRRVMQDEGATQYSGMDASPSAPAPIWRFKPTLPSVRRLKLQIIPKIFLALRPVLAPAEVRQETPAQHDDRIAVFAALSMGFDEDASAGFVDQLLAEGVTVDQIFVSWLAPAARHLGEQWENDTADFASVTIGISRLQRILRTLGESFAEEAGGGGEAILLTTVPGEQHSFGLSMVAEFFRRAGWSLCTGPFATQGDLLTLVQERWFDVVGYSLSSDRNLDKLQRDIVSIRNGSRNPRLGILLGGPMLASHPELVARLGADMMSADAVSAPGDASALVIRMAGQA